MNETRHTSDLEMRDARKDERCKALVDALYKEAFPPEERVSPATMWFLLHRSSAHYVAFFDEGAFAGLALYIQLPSCLYIAFLAVDASMRSRGIGSRILAALAQAYPQLPLVLEIERLDEHAVNYQQRVARLRFYERNGFARTGYLKKEGRQYYEILANRGFSAIEQFKRELRSFFFHLPLFDVVKQG